MEHLDAGRLAEVRRVRVRSERDVCVRRVRSGHVRRKRLHTTEQSLLHGTDTSSGRLRAIYADRSAGDEPESIPHYVVEEFLQRRIIVNEIVKLHCFNVRCPYCLDVPQRLIAFPALIVTAAMLD